MRRALILACALVGGAASAQTYQVGQFLGNLNEAGRFAWGTMGGAASTIPHTNPATWSALAPGVLRHSAQATATIGGRTVPLTLLSRVPVAGIANAARAVSLANPATAAVTLLGFAAMQGWLTPAGLEWNPDALTNLQKPFLIEQDVPGITQTIWYRSPDNQTSSSAGCSSTDPNNTEGTVYCHSPRPFPDSGTMYNGTFWQRFAVCPSGQVRWWDGPSPCAGQTTKEKVAATWDEAIPKLQNPAGDMSAVNWKSIAEGLLQRGASLPAPTDQTLSGPSTQPGQKTTRQNADGTTTTTTTTNNYNYAGNTVTVTNTTNSTVTNNAGDIISSESETTEEQQPDSANDTPLPGQPELYERKYPNGIKGVWDEKFATLKTSSLFGVIPGLTPNLGDGGCPVWTMHVDVGLIDFGTYDISVPCSVWAFVRIVMLITALFLARRLIFGG